MSITLADCSEFQENIDAPQYIDGGHECIIVRAHNGHRPDHRWPARRDYLRKFPFVAIGFYQYLVADRRATDQAREFILTVGDLRLDEFVILDHEEGSGGQIARAEAWFAVVDAHYGKLSTLYAGESFGNDELGGWMHWRRPRWIAAYRDSEPHEPHQLWQNTDRARFPGISGPCDGNIFHGTEQEFMRTFCQVTGPVPPHPPLPKPMKEGTMIAAAVKPDGRIEIFYEASDGEVLHTWQPQPNGGWWGAQAGKRSAGWQSMGKPQQARA